jgi:hypothetical protein
MVHIYGACQWTPAGTFRNYAETEIPNFWVILIRVFLQPVPVQANKQTFKQE